jgi:predicted enzyme related to lactoylglutathione lyase
MSDTPRNICVWFEIPVTDLAKAKTFYEAVLATEMTENRDGPNPMVAFSSMADSGVSGHLYPGKPAAAGTGNTVHLGVSDKLETALERVKPAGGQVVSPIITIPAGRFAYCLDPDGNSFGLFGA